MTMIREARPAVTIHGREFYVTRVTGSATVAYELTGPNGALFLATRWNEKPTTMRVLSFPGGRDLRIKGNAALVSDKSGRLEAAR